MAFKKKQMEQSACEIEPKKKKKKIRIVLVIATVGILIVVGAGVYFLKIKGKNEMPDAQQQIADIMSSYENAVSATGVINIGTVEETLDIDKMTTSLKIEEILFASGDSIKEGDALIKFSEESVEEAFAEVKANLRTAELAYRAGAIEYEQNLITAKYNYDSTILKGEQADAVYRETVESLKSSLEASTKSYNESVEQLAEYTDAQNNNAYYTQYQVEYYKQVYDENLEILKKKMEEWGVPWQDVTSGMARLGQDEYSQYKYVLQLLYSILETNGRDYENALEQYENAQADLNYNYLTLKLDMSSLEENYLNAQKNYEISLLSAEQTRQTAKTNAQLAQSEYEAKVEKAKADYDSLKSAYDDAQADYDTFTKCIVDNTYLATNTGSVMRTSVRNNGTVSAGSRILTYSDLEEVTVSVSVDQSDIAKLSVGDSAIVYASSTGMMTGTIKSISPVTQSSSISSVTYSVVVGLEGRSGAVSANTSVTVLFGVDMESVSGIDFSQTQTDVDDANSQGFPGGNFDMSNMPDFSNMPDMGNMPNMGSRPGN